MITAVELREIMHYDSLSGVFTWLHNSKVAGTVRSDGHIQIRINGVGYQAHRLAWLYVTGEWPKCVIDHINRVTGDNRFINLRDVSISENTLNHGIYKACKNNKLGERGISIDRGFMVRLKGKNYGRFATLEEAIMVRNANQG